MKYTVATNVRVDVTDYAIGCLDRVEEELDDTLANDYSRSICDDVKDSIMVDIFTEIISQAEARRKSYESLVKKYHSNVTREVEKEED